MYFIKCTIDFEIVQMIFLYVKTVLKIVQMILETVKRFYLVNFCSKISYIHGFRVHNYKEVSQLLCILPKGVADKMKKVKVT